MQNSVYFRTSHSASESEDEAPDTHAEDFSFSDFSLLPSLKESRAALRSELLDPYNRLHSIDTDSRFVESVAEHFKLPLIANQRCGAWYTNPARAKDVHAYFKSTDGHAGTWDFNLRRANLHLLPVVLENDGIIMVDSTRRGKRFPDALSKTIPIWCATLNATALHLDPRLDWSTEDCNLYTSAEAVSPSEHAQISARIPSFSRKLLESAYDLSFLKRLDKPLKPIFISPSTDLSTVVIPVNIHPVVCLSASRCLSLDQVSIERSYVQGSGDDHELWSNGLTPTLYWQHRSELLSCDRRALPSLIQSIVSSTQLETASEAVRIGDTQIFLHCHPVSRLPEDWLFTCGEDEAEKTIKLVKGKKGVDQLFVSMPGLVEEARKKLIASKLVVGSTAELGKQGSDAVVALTLVLLVDSAEPHKRLDKSAVRLQVQRIIESTSGLLNPSRTILKRVNEYLLSPK